MTFPSSDHLGSSEVDLKSHIPGHHLLKLVLSAILKTTTVGVDISMPILQKRKTEAQTA